MNPFKGRHFQRDIILWAVRWYVTTGIVKALKFSFLLVSDEYFHGEQHDLLLPKNQASSMITGIYS
ncbi:hypothetical protein EXT33_23325 (plasmid) [Salmonella enterica subsp. enterica serovar Infantis]|nr:hypothetical protein EXT33_23325 [Salmonella enterica subsp. enterica serovar Infantis]